jgi:Sjogren's syndrome/scleroderma autoantigen 1 (Autoantigen p27)
MGDLMLRGWTLLQDSCAVCATPLMRDATGTLLCVTCEAESADSNLDATATGIGTAITVPHTAEIESPELQSTALATVPPPARLSQRRPGTIRDRALPNGIANTGSAGHATGATHGVPSTNHGGGTGGGSNIAPGSRGTGHVRTSAPSGSAVDGGLRRSRNYVIPGEPGSGSGINGGAGGGEYDSEAQDGYVARELRASEAAVAAALGPMRARLAGARDAEAFKAACEAIKSAADSIVRLRRAGGAMTGGCDSAAQDAYVVHELRTSEAAVAAALGPARMRLAGARDSSAVQSACEAIQTAADAIIWLRGAESAVA